MTGRAAGGVALLVALCVALLVGGFVVGLAAVALHGHWWGLLLGWAATLAALFALPRGLPRVAYAAGWLVPVVLGSIERPEGDYAIASNAVGDALLTLGLVLIIATIVTIPVRPRRPRRPRGQ